MAQGDAKYLLVKTKQDKNYFEKCEGQTCYEEHWGSWKHGDLSRHFNEGDHEEEFQEETQVKWMQKKEKKKGLKKE